MIGSLTKHLLSTLTSQNNMPPNRILVKLFRWVKNKTEKVWLAGRISLKWLSDKHHLPLNSGHRELYHIIHKLCFHELGELPHLVDCRDFNDKIQWLKLFDQSEEIIHCSDKILVRNYIQNSIGDQYLVKLYQVVNHFSQIDFDTLPSTFVIKTNNDSGTVILVNDKTKLDFRAAESKIETALKRPYGWNNGEWAYSYIEPKVMVEEFINTDKATPPADYKFHCVNGTIKWLQFIYDRGHQTKEVIINENGLITSIHFDHKMQQGTFFDFPTNWDLMKSVVTKLATPFKYVRIDIYFSNITQKIYVGELTFYPLMGCYKGDGQKQLGIFLDFDRQTYKPILLPYLEQKRSRFLLYPN